jgi:urocanate hydratase
MTKEDFQKLILQGIPEELPAPKTWDSTVNHAPKRKQI